MRSKPLLSKAAQLKTRKAVHTLPMRIADLDGCELVSHCDRCGRHLRLYPGHADFDSRTRLVSLLDRLACSAQRNGRACGGLPRRLMLVRDERRWLLDAAGEWVEDQSLFWEPGDFEARAERSRQAAF
ncbi:hypothetical protein [Dongia sedimenti]|uniref:Uncharacterized protein n=1 Tax=Dongia sedimenti TaxID=3064282 RepID=A0ABU0YFX0_9PROT|nr:hypothetical protein [Rhodospirillaceae bacterium R-7]